MRAEGARQALDAEAPPRWVRWSVFGGLAVVALSRAPYVLFQGRFWAEEGSVHFRHMVAEPSPASVLFVDGRAGYLNLFAEGATWLAARAPLPAAPLVTAWLSVLVVVLVAWVALWWPSDVLPTAGAKVAGAVLLVAGPLAVAEVWANSINAQTTLAVAALLVLLARVPALSRPRFVVAVAVVGLAALSGLYTVVLVPLFVYLAVRDRARRRTVLAAVAGAAGAVQVGIYLWSLGRGAVEETKASLPGAAGVVRGVAGWHLDSLVLPQPLVSRLVASSGGTALVGVLGLAVLALLAWLLWRAPSRRVVGLLVAAFVLVEGLVLVGSVNDVARGRYAVVPLAVLTLALVHGAATASGLRRTVGTVAVAAVAVCGLAQFWLVRPELLRCQGCPGWSDQVAAYERDGAELVIWPYDDRRWTVRLPPPGQG